MSENSLKLQNYIREVNGVRSKYSDAFKDIAQYYKGDDKQRRPPKAFVESSFLYIRSFNEDIGYRPLPNIVFWNSPDISFTHSTSTVPSATNELIAGETYTVRCRLHNGGDVSIPFPKVEFYLTDPSLGFDTRFSTFIGVTQMDGILLAGASGEASFVYRVPASEGGHKCFFARTFSMSPLDKPHDLYALNPVLDRHTGQKNLNITTAAVPYVFNIVHMANSNEAIQFRPLTTKELIGFGEHRLGKFNFREKFSSGVFAKASVKVLSDKGAVRIGRSRAGFRFTSAGEGPGLDEQAKFDEAYINAIQQINEGKAKPSEFKDLFAVRRKMSAFMQQTKLEIQIPDFQLKEGEAVGFNIVNTNMTTGAVKGGIVLVVV